MFALASSDSSKPAADAFCTPARRDRLLALVVGGCKKECARTAALCRQKAVIVMPSVASVACFPRGVQIAPSHVARMFGLTFRP